MGCIFYHVLVPGGHPFGTQWFEREANVVHQRADLSGLTRDEVRREDGGGGGGGGRRTPVLKFHHHHSR